MTYASSRYALVVLILLGAAAIAMTSIRQNPQRVETCRDPDQLLSLDDVDLDDYTLNPGAAVKNSLRTPFVDGYLTPSNPRDRTMAFTIRRTFMLPNWLVRPPSALPGPLEPDRFKTVVIDIDGTSVPIQLAYGMQRGSQSFVAYAMAYNGEPITSPFWLRMAAAPSAVFRGIRPITYIGVAGSMSDVDLPRHEQRAIDFVTSGWRHYQRACRS